MKKLILPVFLVLGILAAGCGTVTHAEQTTVIADYTNFDCEVDSRHTPENVTNPSKATLWFTESATTGSGCDNLDIRLCYRRVNANSDVVDGCFSQISDPDNNDNYTYNAPLGWVFAETYIDGYYVEAQFRCYYHLTGNNIDELGPHGGGCGAGQPTS